MNKEDKVNIQEIIDRVYASCNTNAILLASNEHTAKRLKEEFPGIEIIFNSPNKTSSSETVYIIPAEERPIKIIYEDKGE